MVSFHIAKFTANSCLVSRQKEQASSKANNQAQHVLVPCCRPVPRPGPPPANRLTGAINPYLTS